MNHSVNPGSISRYYPSTIGSGGPPGYPGQEHPENFGYVENAFGDRYWSSGNGGGGHPGITDRIERIIGATGGSASTPALSALGLLAFLFFLNMIQNSLVTNSFLTMRLSRGNNNTRLTTRRRRRRRPVAAAAVGRILTDTDDLTQINLDPANIDIEDADEQIAQNSDEVSSEEVSSEELNSNEAESQIESPIANSTSTRARKKFRRSLSPRTIQTKCVKLLACKLGRYLHSVLGGFASELLMSFVMPRTRELLGCGLSRALSNGWSFEKPCRKLYKECTFGSLLRSANANPK